GIGEAVGVVIKTLHGDEDLRGARDRLAVGLAGGVRGPVGDGAVERAMVAVRVGPHAILIGVVLGGVAAVEEAAVSVGDGVLIDVAGGAAGGAGLDLNEMGG